MSQMDFLRTSTGGRLLIIANLRARTKTDTSWYVSYCFADGDVAFRRHTERRGFPSLMDCLTAAYKNTVIMHQLTCVDTSQADISLNGNRLLKVDFCCLSSLLSNVFFFL